LRERAAAKNLLYGAAGSHPALSNDFDYAAAFARECGILAPENALKWKALRPTPDRFDFVQADWLHNFTRSHGMKFRGHTLVWHEMLPEWFAGVMTRSNARDMLEQHIRTVAGHYSGRIHSWDVVNEAVLVTDHRDDGLRKTPWLDLLGPEYLEIAFSAAAAADPGAMLVYSDYGLDYDDAVQQAKRLAVLAHLRRLKRNGIPLHAFGMQAHLAGDSRQFRPEV
jgi:endo-1,4-beta-xylanase